MNPITLEQAQDYLHKRVTKEDARLAKLLFPKATTKQTWSQRKKNNELFKLDELEQLYNHFRSKKDWVAIQHLRPLIKEHSSFLNTSDRVLAEILPSPWRDMKIFTNDPAQLGNSLKESIAGDFRWESSEERQLSIYCFSQHFGKAIEVGSKLSCNYTLKIFSIPEFNQLTEVFYAEDQYLMLPSGNGFLPLAGGIETKYAKEIKGLVQAASLMEEVSIERFRKGVQQSSAADGDRLVVDFTRHGEQAYRMEIFHNDRFGWMMHFDKTRDSADKDTHLTVIDQTGAAWVDTDIDQLPLQKRWDFGDDPVDSIRYLTFY